MLMGSHESDIDQFGIAEIWLATIPEVLRQSVVLPMRRYTALHSYCSTREQY